MYQETDTLGIVKETSTGDLISRETWRWEAVQDWLNAGHTLAPCTPPESLGPQSVTRYQALMALHSAGKLSQVQTMMVNPTTPIRVQLAWQNATTFLRRSDMVETMGLALGLTEEDIDALFLAASAVT